MERSTAFFSKVLCALAVTPLLAMAAGSGAPLDTAPIDLHDKISLQRGAHAFANYCIGCHSASYMRYSRLTDLGLSEQQIKNYLLPSAVKVGETMNIAMRKEDGQQWFGVAPPDLSVIARARGADWLYTYLRTFYQDESRPTGWNNWVFDKVGMPHALWQLQGIQVLKVNQKKDAHGNQAEEKKLELTAQGQLSPREYDVLVADLVNYLTYMGEPDKSRRTRLGIIVLFFLTVMFVVTLLLKKEYWKDVK
ncbi:MAG: cytochrome c1 [Burkholderiales bacterium]|nr:cytochrome c1 [Burkholderiales bacterium]